MSEFISERIRSATFGPVAISLAKHGTYETHLPGNNFGLPWRAARFFFPMEGELRFRPNTNSEVWPVEQSAENTRIWPVEQRSGRRNQPNGNETDSHTVGAKAAALAVGWHPVHLACEGAQVLEVDVATERFAARDLLNKFKFTTWAAHTCLPSATAAALHELLERPASSEPIRAETNRVVESLITALLQVAHLSTETATV